ncbi:MAG: nucleotidyltransferase domain-containing protein [Ruminococcus sp.]|jgi:predicted nucleotidyltransferase
MRYKKYTGSVEELIKKKLNEIEEKENIRVLHAVESGSRAWGIASPDSDYDVRFVYVRPVDFYLELQDKKDFIDWELNEVLDINGWDITKALQHFYKSNATLYEWGNSPIIYKTTPQWEKIMKIAGEYFSCKSSMYHYYGTAKKNYETYLMEDMVKYKKYFYVLRPLLACKWIEKKKCPPPVLFQTLEEEILEKEIKPAVDRLVEAKLQMTEGEKRAKIQVLNDYILENLEYYQTLLAKMPEDRKKDWSLLNRSFRELL